MWPQNQMVTVMSNKLSLLTLFFLLFLFAYQASANNLLTNPSFESGDKSGWTGSGQVIKAVAVSGEYSVRIFGDTSKWYNLRQSVDVMPGGIYRFSGNLRVWNMSTGSYQFHVRWYDENGAELKDARRYFGMITSSSLYSEQARDLMVPANAVTASFRLTANKADGVGYFDALSVTLIEAPATAEELTGNTVTKSLLINASFETGNKSPWSGSGQIINAGAQDGEYALRIFGNTSGWPALVQNVPVEEKKKYTLSGHMKTGSMTQGSYRLQVRWYDDNGHEISGTRYNFATQSYNSSTYKAYSSEVFAPAGAVEAAFRIQANQADGHAVVDNLALDTKISLPPLVSSVQPNRTDLESQYAFDGDMSTRWSSEFADNQWITKDMGRVETISSVSLDWEYAYGKSYEIQVSNDLYNWLTVYQTTQGDGGLDVITFDAVDARYVKMYGTERATQYGFSLWEFEVNPVFADPVIDFSAADLELNSGETTILSWSTTHATSCEATGAWSGGKSLSGMMTTEALLSDSSFILTCANELGAIVSRTVFVPVLLPEPQEVVIQNATASSYDEARSRYPSNAFDDDATSKWTATGTSNWITLDLGAVQIVSQTRMYIYVGGVDDFRYSVSVSTDNANWSEVFSKGSISLTPNWTVADFTPTEARYVRVTLTAPVSNYINLYDFEVHGHAIDSIDPVDPPIDPITPPIEPPPVLDTLSWNANTDTVDGYVVYHGPTGANASTEYTTVSATEAPSVTYDAINGLGYSAGDQICFRVKAYLGSEYSDWSAAVCDTVD